jgi:hypothetical protein
MNLTLRITGICAKLFWPSRRNRKQKKTFGMSPEQWAARAKALGIDGEPQNEPNLARKAA